MVADRQQEIDLIKQVIRHPSGMHVSMFDMLWIRWTDQASIEVEWEDVLGRVVVRSFLLDNELDQAVEFFVDKRRELGLGIDIEADFFNQITSKE
jgi:hypothetical protein